MFFGAAAFNQPLDWDVSKVTYVKVRRSPWVFSGDRRGAGARVGPSLTAGLQRERPHGVSSTMFRASVMEGIDQWPTTGAQERYLVVLLWSIQGPAQRYTQARPCIARVVVFYIQGGVATHLSVANRLQYTVRLYTAVGFYIPPSALGSCQVYSGATAVARPSAPRQQQSG